MVFSLGCGLERSRGNCSEVNENDIEGDESVQDVLTIVVRKKVANRQGSWDHQGKGEKEKWKVRVCVYRRELEGMRVGDGRKRWRRV